MGTYPFAKILIAVAYMNNCIINSLYNRTYLSFHYLLFSDTAMNLWNSVECFVHLHIRIKVLMSLPVLQTVSH